MIDFANGSIFKLSVCKPEEIVPSITPLMVPGEQQLGHMIASYVL